MLPASLTKFACMYSPVFLPLCLSVCDRESLLALALAQALCGYKSVLIASDQQPLA